MLWAIVSCCAPHTVTHKQHDTLTHKYTLWHTLTQTPSATSDCSGQSFTWLGAPLGVCTPGDYGYVLLSTTIQLLGSYMSNDGACTGTSLSASQVVVAGVGSNAVCTSKAATAPGAKPAYAAGSVKVARLGQGQYSILAYQGEGCNAAATAGGWAPVVPSTCNFITVALLNANLSISIGAEGVDPNPAAPWYSNQGFQLAVGLGVGLGVGLPLLLAAACCGWRHHVKARKDKVAKALASAAPSKAEEQAAPAASV